MNEPTQETRSESADGANQVPILMPEASNSMETGTVLDWRVREGDWVDVGQILCDIETDKAVIEYESPAAGRIQRIAAAVGEVVPVRRPIAFLSVEGTNGGRSAQSTVDAIASQQPREPVAPSNATPGGDTQHPEYPPARVIASPSVRRRARELNIPLESLSRGSGPNGRLILSDLEALTSDGERYSADAPSVPESAATPSVLHRMSKMRRTIADRLQQSKQTIPHFYLRVSVRVDRLWALRATLTDVQATLNDWILLACGRALAESPILRSRLRGDEIVESSDCNIGVAVAVADGVLVPVVKNVDKLRLAQLAAETKRIIGDTRKGVIANAGQGVFTITNLGMHGIDEFSAIINPPEAAILAVGAAREQVVAENGSIRVGRTLVLTLSADHRLVDGAAAAGFLTKLRLLLELEDEVWWR